MWKLKEFGYSGVGGGWYCYSLLCDLQPGSFSHLRWKREEREDRERSIFGTMLHCSWPPCVLKACENRNRSQGRRKRRKRTIQTETEDTHECTVANALIVHSRQTETHKQKQHGNTLGVLPLSLSLCIFLSFPYSLFLNPSNQSDLKMEETHQNIPQIEVKWHCY